ncbi:hypothetical protein DFJ73DRAFT_66657 [Zopfochytrium polystomum]|nr:hypothetical protein DFJ73DRAFT_66657 [Zopfochytrium polystomum]
MKVTVIGASLDTVGAHVARQALELGHTVTVLARDPARLRLGSDGTASGAAATGLTGLTVVTGSVTVAADVAAALSADTQVVVNAVGGRGGDSGSPGAATVASDSSLVLVPAIKERCPGARLITVTSMGCGDSLSTGGWVVWGLVKTVLARPIADKDKQEATVVAASDWLDWVTVRPSGLTDGPKTGKYKTGAVPGSQISRSDVADFVVKCFQGDEWKHKSPSVTY